MTPTHFSEDIDYDGPERCASCGRGADRPYTCEECAAKRASEAPPVYTTKRPVLLVGRGLLAEVVRAAVERRSR